MTECTADLLSSLKNGRSVHVKTPDGVVFEIRPKTRNGLRGYAVYQNGKQRSGYRILKTNDLVSWLNDLEVPP